MDDSAPNLGPPQRFQRDAALIFRAVGPRWTFDRWSCGALHAVPVNRGGRWSVTLPVSVGVVVMAGLCREWLRGCGGGGVWLRSRGATVGSAAVSPRHRRGGATPTPRDATGEPRPTPAAAYGQQTANRPPDAPEPPGYAHWCTTLL